MPINKRTDEASPNTPPWVSAPWPSSLVLSCEIMRAGSPNQSNIEANPSVRRSGVYLGSRTYHDHQLSSDFTTLSDMSTAKPNSVSFVPSETETHLAHLNLPGRTYLMEW